MKKHMASYSIWLVQYKGRGTEGTETMVGSLNEYIMILIGIVERQFMHGSDRD